MMLLLFVEFELFQVSLFYELVFAKDFLRPLGNSTIIERKKAREFSVVKQNLNPAIFLK